MKKTHHHVVSDRRESEDRRHYNGSCYKGPERRSGKERRTGKERRKAVLEL